MAPESNAPQLVQSKCWLTYRWAIAASALMLISACGGGGTPETATSLPPTIAVTKTAVILDKNFGGYALIGEVYEGFARIVPQDTSITVISSVMKNRTEGGATPEVGADGKVKWAANDKDFLATDSLQITAKLSNGEEVSYDIPVEVRKQRVILKKTLETTENIYSDDEGRYLIQVSKKTGSSSITGEISVNEMYRKNGEFTWSLKTVGDNFDLSILQAPMTQWSGSDSVATAAKLQGFTQVGLVSGEGTTKHPIEKLSVGRGAFSSLHTNGSVIRNGTNVYSSRHAGESSYNIPPTFGGEATGDGNTTNGSSASLVNNIKVSRDSFEVFWFGSNCADKAHVNDFSYLSKCQTLANTRSPIILIHGFSGTDNIWHESIDGGGEGTWGSTAQYLTEREFPVFEMRWLSYMPFEDAAGALARFGEAIALKTGKKPIILAHSFGGIVSHLALQNKGREWSVDVVDLKAKWNLVKTDGVFARLITLNSPLSGINEGNGKGKFNKFKSIYNSAGTLENVAFPRGVDLSDFTISKCYAVTCAQAGKNFGDDKYSNQFQLTFNKLLIDDVIPTLNGSTITETKSKDLRSGETIASIQRDLSTSNAPFTTVVGYKNIKNLRPDYYGLGDGLISLMGQALIPQDFSDQAFDDIDTTSFRFKFDGIPFETLRGEKQKMLNTLTKGDCFKYKVSVRDYLVCASSAHTSSMVNNYSTDIVNSDIPSGATLSGYYKSNPVANFSPGTSHILSILTEVNYLAADPQPIIRLAPNPAISTVDMRFISSTGAQQIGLLSSSIPVKYALVWAKIIEKTSGVVKNQFLGAKSDENGKVNIDIGSMISAKFGADAKLEDYRVSLTVDPIGKLKPWRMEIENLQASLDLGDIDLSPTTTRVTSISPQIAQLKLKTTFTVNGQNLPMTAVMSMTDATCETPTRRSITGFQVVCTPNTSIGVKSLVINTAAEGTVIDSNKTVTIIPASIPSSSWSLSMDKVSVSAVGGTSIGNPTYFLGKDNLPAVSFASGSKLKIPNREEIKVGTGATFDVWVKVSAGGWGTIFAKSHDTLGVALMLYGAASGITQAHLATFDSTWNCTPNVSKSANVETLPVIPYESWIRVTAVIDPKDGYRTYINKQLSTWCKGIKPSVTVMDTQDMFIGGFSDFWWPMTGSVQNLKVYKTALTESQIKALP